MTHDCDRPRSHSRRRQLIGRAVATSLAILAAVQPAAAQQTRLTATRSHAMQLAQDWDKTFPKSPRVDHRKVTFKNRYGITLAADLYTPRERGSGKLPAVAVSGPFG